MTDNVTFDPEAGVPQEPSHDDFSHEEDLSSGDDGFNEFDAPGHGQKGGTLGEMWRNNPIIKLGVIGVGVVAVVAAFVIFGMGGKQDDQSRVGTALKEHEAPGNDTTEAYRDAINEVNQQRLDQAVQTGQSTMPIPVSDNTDNSLQDGSGTPPASMDDPLAGWRSGSQQSGPDPTLEPTSPQLVGGNGQGGNGAQQQVMPSGPDPQAVDALANAMTQQMQQILDKHKILPPQIMQVTSADYLEQKAQKASSSTGGASTAQNAPVVKEILIPAGTIVYAQTLTEANTDAPGPVLARLSSGPLAGARILGSFKDTEDYLILDFNTVVVNGISQSVNAVAIDPKTTLPALASEVDRRYWRRVLLPAAARFIEGMGNAIAQNEQTVVVTADTTTVSQPKLNTREQVAAGLAAGTSKLSEELDNEGNRTKVMIKVNAGTPIGVLFLEPVVKDSGQ
ncbi:MAG: hypothetical protein H6865_03865 [Rhodospirillales bacterium]|nr:DotG/IcmE/VirB10 family protein [Alphaproteobacteria bacterium]MCB9986753.1 hypothetical protein [Rhodospirillales bacterium]USO08479.1 MAG: DotG/IcmE/VirB10 family protein [Rhodospirillales bacterium]